MVAISHNFTKAAAGGLFVLRRLWFFLLLGGGLHFSATCSSSGRVRGGDARHFRAEALQYRRETRPLHPPRAFSLPRQVLGVEGHAFHEYPATTQRTVTAVPESCLDVKK